MTIKSLLLGAAALAMPAAGFAQSVTTETAGEVKAGPAGAAVDADVNASNAQTVDGNAATGVQADTATDATATNQASAADAAAGATTAATAADVTAGKSVMDTAGAMVGTIEKVDANGAVISTGTARVQIPVTSFAKNDRGLVISASKAELEAAAKTSSPS